MRKDEIYERKKYPSSTEHVECIQQTYLNQNYTLRCCSHNKIKDTGLLKVAELKPKQSNLPLFLLRWDYDASELDIDIYVGNEIRNELWKIRGWRGHKTKEIDKQKKIFEVNIVTPERKIFKGWINLTLFMKLFIKNGGTGKTKINVEK